MKRWIILGATTLGLVPTIFLLVWYIFFFIPNLSKINQAVKSGHLQVEPIMESFYQIVIITESKEGIRFRAINNAYCSLVYSGRSQDCKSVHFNNILWSFIGSAHLSEVDEFGLWIKCALNDCEDSIAKASQRYYRKQINELTTRKQAGLAVYVSCPAKYEPGTPESDKRINEIMDKFGS